MGRQKRRNFFINKDLQGRYIFSAFISVVAGSVLFALLFGFFSSNTLSIVYDDYHLRLGTTPSLLFDKIFSAQWFFIVLGGVGIAVVFLFLSHRVAGPFYRFEKTLEKMVTGDLSGVLQLRKRDEGKILGEKINSFNDMMCQRLGEIRQAAEKIKESCDVLAGKADEKAAVESFQAEIEKIRELNRACLANIEEFKLNRTSTPKPKTK